MNSDTYHFRHLRRHPLPLLVAPPLPIALQYACGLSVKTHAYMLKIQANHSPNIGLEHLVLQIKLLNIIQQYSVLG